MIVLGYMFALAFLCASVLATSPEDLPVSSHSPSVNATEAINPGAQTECCDPEVESHCEAAGIPIHSDFVTMQAIDATASAESSGVADCPICFAPLKRAISPKALNPTADGEVCEHSVCATCCSKWIRKKELENSEIPCPLCKRSYSTEFCDFAKKQVNWVEITW